MESTLYKIGVLLRGLLVVNIVICPLCSVVRWQISISQYSVVKVRNKLPCLSILSHISKNESNSMVNGVRKGLYVSLEKGLVQTVKDRIIC